MGAEVLMLTVGPELFYVMLTVLEETGFFNASLYTPFGIAGIETLGYETVSRYSSTDALEAFRARPESFDLVITDMTMPHMTGIDLAKEIFRIRPQTPLVLCTGFSETVDEDKAKLLGIKKLLMKPVSMRDLAVIVSEIIVPDTQGLD